VGDQPERRPRQKYWGLRTLGFLTLALVSVLAMSWTSSPLTLLGLVVGLTGATYCSWRGLKDFTWLPR
jgi:4-hydroxybenzoate polyprenyltransferase